MNVLPRIPITKIEGINPIIRSFTWGTSKEKISMAELMLDKKQGGLRMVDLANKELALKIQLVKVCYEQDDIQNIADYLMGNELKSLVWKVNLRKNQVHRHFKASFWRDVLEAWLEYTFVEPDNMEQMREQSLWLDSLYHMENRALLNRKAMSNNIYHVGDILDENGNP